MEAGAAKSRVLFAPWGNGSGHVMRAMVLAKQARAQEWSPVIAAADDTQSSLVRDNGFELCTYADATAGLDPWLAWSDAKFWLTAIGNDRLHLRETEADMVVVDSRLSMHVAASLEGVPLVGVVQDMDFPGYTYPGREREALWGRVEAALREVFAAHGLEYVMDDPRELIVSGGTVVPGTPESDDLPAASLSDPVFIGPITGFSTDVDVSRTVADDTILFYKTVLPDDVDEFQENFADLLPKVCIATGDPDKTARLEEALGGTGARVADFWSIGPRSRPALAIIHGGHGTLHHMAQAGVPALVVPDLSPERYANAVKADRVPSMKGVVHGVDPARLTWSAQGGGGSVVSFKEIREAYDGVDFATVRQRAESVARRYDSYDLRSAWQSVVECACVPELD